MKPLYKLPDNEIKSTVMQDISYNENIINSELKPKWDYAYKRYLGIRDTDVELEDWQSDQTMNLGFGIVTSEVAQLVSGLYQPNQFFDLKPRNKKSKDILTVLEKLIPIQAQNMNFHRLLTWLVSDACIYGTGWVYMTWGKKIYENETAEAVGKDEVKTQKKRKVYKYPIIKIKSVYDVVYDTETEDINDMLFWACKEYETIENIRNDDRYDHEDKKAFLKKIDEMSDKEKPKRVMLWTYWAKDSVCVITEDNYILRAGKNLYGRIPARAMVKYPLQREVVGIGTIEAIGDQLDYTDEMMNIQADGAFITTIPQYFTNMDLSPEDETIYPGKIWLGKQGETFEEIRKGSIGYDGSNVLKQTDDYINRVVGNVDQVDAQGIDTATESRIIAARSNTKKQAFINYAKEDVMKWILEFWIEMNIDNLTIDEMVKQIGDIEWEKTEVNADILKDLKNMDIDYTISMTADNGLEDRLVAVQTLERALQTIAQVAQLAGAGVPINAELIIKWIISKFDLPEGTFKDIEQVQGGEDVTVSDDAVAEEMGLTQDELVRQIAAKEGLTEEQVKQAIAKAGGLQAFLQAKAQEEKSGVQQT